MAGELPVVKQYRQLPATLRNFINPLSNATPTGGTLRSLLKGGTAAVAGDILLSELAKNYLNPQQKQALDEFLITTSVPGNPIGKLLTYGVFNPQPAGANEDDIMQRLNEEYYRKVRQYRGSDAATPAVHAAPKVELEQTLTPEQTLEIAREIERAWGRGSLIK
jgi:hypothetical protein